MIVYISPTGSDSYTYAQAQSSATPWATIGKCNTSATTGDTIIVMAGTYTIPTVSVDFTKSFNIEGATNDSSLYVFDGAGLTIGSSNYMWRISEINAHFTIKNIQIRNMKTPSGYGGGVGSGVIVLNNNNQIVTIQNVVFHDIDTFCSYAIGGIISCSNTSLNVNSVLNVTNCLFYDIRETGNPPGGSANSGLVCNRLIPSFIMNITNSTFYTKVGHGWDNASFIYSGGYAYVKNCIFQDAAGTMKGGTVTTSTYNCYHNLVSYTAGTGVITSDPLFVDAANSNFALRPNSPCLETGTLI